MREFGFDSNDLRVMQETNAVHHISDGPSPPTLDIPDVGPLQPRFGIESEVEDDEVVSEKSSELRTQVVVPGFHKATATRLCASRNQQQRQCSVASQFRTASTGAETSSRTAGRPVR